MSHAQHTRAEDHHGHGDIEQPSPNQFVGRGEWTGRDEDDDAHESNNGHLEERISLDRDVGTLRVDNQLGWPMSGRRPGHGPRRAEG